MVQTVVKIGYNRIASLKTERESTRGCILNISNSKKRNFSCYLFWTFKHLLELSANILDMFYFKCDINLLKLDCCLTCSHRLACCKVCQRRLCRTSIIAVGQKPGFGSMLSRKQSFVSWMQQCNVQIESCLNNTLKVISTLW